MIQLLLNFFMPRRAAVTTKEYMNELSFLMCASKLNCDTENDLETVGLEGSQGKYHISFYGDVKTDYSLVVEEFGKYNEGVWEALEPTIKQLEIMQLQLRLQVDKIYESLAAENETRDRLKQKAEEALAYGHPGAIYNAFY